MEGDRIYIVWQDSFPGNNDIFFASSSDEGLTFSEPLDISNTDGPCPSLPQIAVSDDNIYIVWQDIHPPTTFLLRRVLTEAPASAIQLMLATRRTALHLLRKSPSRITMSTSPGKIPPQVTLRYFFTRQAITAAYTFSEAVNLSNTVEGVSSSPQLAPSSNGTILHRLARHFSR